jgi:hypothetical protein
MKLWLLILIFLQKSPTKDIHVLKCLLVWIRISGYYAPCTKQPENSLKKAQWLGIAHSAGDAMTYFIETE